MIKLENFEVVGWEHAIRGMRNPMNSWERSDSGVMVDLNPVSDRGAWFEIGPNDHELMMKLAKGGPVHAKYRRMIVVYVDITAPLYWWKEFDTYKVGTVANSCSTMHKIHEKEFTLEDFSVEHLEPYAHGMMKSVIETLNFYRDSYNASKNGDPESPYNKENMKACFHNMIQLLPTSYNQRRTVMLNYEILHNIYVSRKNHKLDEWREMCKWIEGLPYSEIITGEKHD